MTTPSPTPPRAGVAAGIAAAIALTLALAASVVKPWEAPGGQPVLIGYADPIGIPTDCYGNTQGAVIGVKRTAPECEDLLREDLAEALAIVNRCVPGPKQPHQAAALVSFAYNVGGGRRNSPGKKDGKDGLCTLANGNEPRIRRFANAGEWGLACAELMNWTRAGGRVFKGLVNRRTAERKLCEGRIP